MLKASLKYSYWNTCLLINIYKYLLMLPLQKPMNFLSFVANLKDKLQNYPLPGQDAQYIMAGDNIRHKKIDLHALSNYKKSAVCLLLYENKGDVYFILIKRPTTHQYHAGQIALPGGS